MVENTEGAFKKDNSKKMATYRTQDEEKKRKHTKKKKLLNKRHNKGK
jgi:hypothetical protein